MDLLKAVRQCITGQAQADHPANINEKEKPVSHLKTPSAQPTEEEIASSILSVLFAAEKSGHDLECTIQDIVHSCSWSEGLATRILDGLVVALNSGATMGGAMKEAFNRATAAASEFVHEHPVLTAAMATVVAIGILVI